MFFEWILRWVPLISGFIIRLKYFLRGAFSRYSSIPRVYGMVWRWKLTAYERYFQLHRIAHKIGRSLIHRVHR